MSEYLFFRQFLSATRKFKLKFYWSDTGTDRILGNILYNNSFSLMRVKGGVSLRNGIIMSEECNLCGMTINYASSEIFEDSNERLFN